MTATLKLATWFIFSLNFISCLGLEVILDGTPIGMYDMSYSCIKITLIFVIFKKKKINQ